MQVLAGDILSAQQSYWHYFGLWQLFGALPERFLYPQGHLHPNQQQYPLRPELLESTFYLYQVSWHGTVGDRTCIHAARQYFNHRVCGQNNVTNKQNNVRDVLQQMGCNS